MVSNAGRCMAIVIAISQLVLIAIVIYIAENSVSECEDTITQQFVRIRFTVTLTTSPSTLTHSAAHFYVIVSVFLSFDVRFTIQLIFRWWHYAFRWIIGEP